MRVTRTLDVIALAGVNLCLAIAFYYQLVFRELPCALCNLERVGFILFGGGLLLNVLHRTSPWNYTLGAVGALVGSLVGLLQMFVHALPGTPPVGNTFLGLHMYDWSYIVLTCAIFYALVSLAFLASNGWLRIGKKDRDRSAGAAIVSTIFIVLVGANFSSAFLENGFHPFKGGGQHHYQMLYDGDVMKP